MNRLLDGTYDHYSCLLPKKLSTPSSLLLKTFYSGITVEKDQMAAVEQLPDDAIIVYVTKTKSNFEYLFYHTYYSRNGLSTPEIGFDYRVFIWQPLSRLFKIFLAHLGYFFQHLSFQNPYKNGYFQRELLSGRAGFLSLVEKGEFYRRFVKAKVDPIRHLIEVQNSIDRPIYLVPLLMFFGKDPHRSSPSIVDMLFGNEARPGKIRRLVTLFKSSGKVFVEISEPVNLRTFVEGAGNQNKTLEHQSLFLRRNLLRQINRHRQSITGPVLKSLEELKESILTNERFQQFMEKHSQSRQIPMHQVRKKADGYLKEIAANYRTGLIKFGSIVVGYIANTIFDGISMDNDGLKFVKTASQKGPLILIPCHKSHIDYLILSYLLYNNNMPAPHIAAGKNLAFWPVGSIFRRGGAFFIRRTFRGAVLYSKVFTEYLYKLLQEGFNIEFFIEGTRSRTGKLIPPKLGFLSMLLEAYKNGACEDMIFAPIYIGYDRVLEESAYIHELEGGRKEPENLLQVIKARKLLKKRYGKIFVRFHEPLSLKHLLDEQGTTIQQMTTKEKNAFCRDLGFRMINSITKAAVVTAHGLCASAILNTTRSRFTFLYLKSIVEMYLNHLQTQETELADTLIIDHNHAIDNALDAYVQRKFIETLPRDKGDKDTEPEYAVNVNERTSLEYYKNNCIAFFIPAAYTAIEVLNRDAFQFTASEIYSGYAFLRKLFRNDFAYDKEITTERSVRKSIKTFIDEAFLMPHQTLPDTYNVTSAGFRKMKLFANFLKTYFESYRIVLQFFLQTPKNAMDAKERLKKIEARGRRMYKRGQIEREEALSKVNYINAVEYFISQGIKGSDDAEKIKVYMDAINQYLSCLQ